MILLAKLDFKIVQIYAQGRDAHLGRSEILNDGNFVPYIVRPPKGIMIVSTQLHLCVCFGFTKNRKEKV